VSESRAEKNAAERKPKSPRKRERDPYMKRESRQRGEREYAESREVPRKPRRIICSDPESAAEKRCMVQKERQERQRGREWCSRGTQRARERAEVRKRKK